MGINVKIDKEPLLVKIPLKPYLVKFLTTKYGPYHKASKTTLLGLEALDLLTSDWSKKPIQKSKSYFILKIPFGICSKYGHFIDYSKIPVFQKKMDKLFKDLLVEHISINCKKKTHGEAIKSIHNLFSYYGISEEDFSYDYAYKLMQRNEESKVKNRQKKYVR